MKLVMYLIGVEPMTCLFYRIRCELTGLMTINFWIFSVILSSSFSGFEIIKISFYGLDT